MENNLTELSKEVAVLKKTVEQIQIFIEDSFLTSEEEEIISKGMKEYSEGKTISMEALKQKYA